MTPQLQIGEKRKLADLLPGLGLRVQVQHDLTGADVSAFGLSSERRLEDDRYFVFYNQPQSPNGEIRLVSEGVFEVNLAALPASVSRIVFAITHDSQPLSALGHLRLTLAGADGTPAAEVLLTGEKLAGERALMLAELYLHGGEWRVTNVSQGFNGGLDALLRSFGGEVAEEGAAAPSPVAPPAPAPVAPPVSSPAPVPTPAPLTPPSAPASVPNLGRHSPPPAPAPTFGSGQEPPMSGLESSLGDFLRGSAEQDRPGDVFELESGKMLEVKVRGRVWSKMGAMVAYRGRLEFNRASTLSDLMGHMRGGNMGGMLGGLMNAAVRMGSEEMGPLVAIEGQGICYLADQGKDISIIRLEGDALNVNGNDLLAFEDTVQHQITMQRSVAGMISGGPFSVRVQGHGLVAILSHGQPLTLRVTPQEPVFTDPNATIAWSEHLQPELFVDQDLRAMFGRGGGETYRMAFRGSGFVVVQPYEEVPVMGTMH
ncbi:AIM24 family protein [Deinococcus sp.]|uniref:AIM24 family protein n=1 Tax=Deinococcus sp. TaxID=47478 RepID=UPI0034C6BB26